MNARLAPGVILGAAAGGGGVGTADVRWLADSATTAGAFALLEKSLAPRLLAAPLHRHTREDEYSYVIEGTLGALLGDELVVAGAGDLMVRPRGQWHTFWNPGDTSARYLDVVTPAGFEGFFAELVALDGAAPDSPSYQAVCDRYGLEVRPETAPEIAARFDLRFPA